MRQCNRIALSLALVAVMLLSLWAIESDAAGTPPYLFVSSTNTDSVKRYDALTGAFVDDFVPPGSGGLRYTHA